MIELRNVSKSYKRGEKVVEDINLTINKGEIFGFIGPNGAGKTTTIKMITGILKQDKGTILLDGKDIVENPVEAKKMFGFVPDSPDMFLKLTGIEYLNFIADIYEISEKKRNIMIETLCKEFGIYEFLNNKIKSYSHGMRQKIVIIGALLHEPENLILDEPITGLDPISSFDLKEILKNYAEEGKTVFFSTHILEIAEKLCDRVGIINKGRLIFVGTLEELKNLMKKDSSLEELFMEIVDDEK